MAESTDVSDIFLVAGSRVRSGCRWHQSALQLPRLRFRSRTYTRTHAHAFHDLRGGGIASCDETKTPKTRYQGKQIKLPIPEPS